jgi:glycosyltransferase involved in cell wall biosynthesis
MRILFLTQWFNPEPMFKGLAFAKALRDRGHSVQVLTGFPNYPEGRIYPGYRLRVLQRELLDGIEVIRVPLYPSHDSSGWRRMLNYVSFAFAASLIGPWVVRPADVMYVYHPPATVALPAAVIGKLRGIPFVYDIQDLWPDTLAATGMVRSGVLLRLVGWWCRLTHAMADQLAVPTMGFKSVLSQRGVPNEKVEVIYNWCEEEDIAKGPSSPAAGVEPASSGRFRVVFAGTIGKAQALESVLKAADILKKADPSVQFVFVGGGTEVERLQRLADEMELPNVVFAARRAVAEIGAILKSADVLLVHLRDDPLFAVTIPSKTQAYMAAGRPIVMAVRGDAAELVGRARAGVVCPPEDPEELAKTILGLVHSPRERLEAMGESGREFYWRELSRSVAVARFEELFRRIAAGRQVAGKGTGGVRREG